MKYEEIIVRVQRLTGIKNDEEADQLLKAVLGTLGEIIYRTEERQIAAQLPKELKDSFYEYQSKETGRAAVANYPLEEFHNRIKARANLTSFKDAQRQTKIIMSILKEAVTSGEIQKAIPGEFQELMNTDNLETRVQEEISSPENIIEEYHVRPDENKKWIVQRGKNKEILGVFEHKEQAIVHADDIADGNRGDILVIYNIDGSISKRREPATRETLAKEAVD